MRKMKKSPPSLSEAQCSALINSWESIERKQNRPKDPLVLLSMIKEAYEYPVEGLPPLARIERFQTRKHVGKAYENFRLAAIELAAVLETESNFYFLLRDPYIYFDSTVDVSFVERLEEQLPLIARLPPLKPQDRKPSNIADPLAEAMALLVCHYVIENEGSRNLRAEFIGREPIGREAQIYTATLNGLGYNLKGSPSTSFRRAKDRILSQDSADIWLEIIRELHVALDQ